MDREQALNAFWNGFCEAYDENTVPEDAVLPRITYEVAVDEFNNPVSMTASIWDRSRSWASVTALCHTIEDVLRGGGKIVRYDTGAIWIKAGTPFAQRMSDPDDTIRRIVLNIEAEYIGG